MNANAWSGRNVVVVGCNSGIGRRLAELLISQGANVYGVGRSQVPSLPGKALSGYSAVDLRHAMPELPLIGRPDLVFHCAAKAGDRVSVQTKAMSTFENALIDFNVLTWIIKVRPCRVIYASSATAAAAPSLAGAQGRYDSEPDGAFGYLKRTTEVVLSQLRVGEVLESVASARIFTVYGVPESRSSVLEHWVKNATASGLIDVWGGNQLRSFVHVDDVCSALLVVGDSNFFGSVDIGHEEMSVLGAAKLVRAALGEATEIAVGPYPFESLKNQRADLSTLRSLGWTPRITLEDYLTALIRKSFVTG